MTSGNQSMSSPCSIALTKAAKKETIVEYSFERNEKSNMLAIHQTRPLIAYLINIKLPQKISKDRLASWIPNSDTKQSPSSLNTNGGGSNCGDSTNTVCIRIMDYVTRQRCLTKGVFLARPADCAFTINSTTCSKSDIIKLAIVDYLANIYLYDISYFIDELTATRIAVIRSPTEHSRLYKSIHVVWCPFVPCEDFEDGDGGLRLAVSSDSRIEVFAIDRLQGKTGEFQRTDLKGAYSIMNDAEGLDVVSMGISPDCSTLSSTTTDNRISFHSCDIYGGQGVLLHTWKAPVKDKDRIAKLFFLDDYTKLLQDNDAKFWGAAFLGTRCGQMFVIDLRDWSIHQKLDLTSEVSGQKNFDYRIDITSRNVMALNGDECFWVEIDHTESNDLDMPKMRRTIRLCNPSRLDSHNNPFFSYVIKHKSLTQLEMFTISAGSLDKYVINLNTLRSESNPQRTISPNELQKFFQKFDDQRTKQPLQTPQTPQPQASPHPVIQQTPPQHIRHQNQNQNSGSNTHQQLQAQQNVSSPLVTQRNKEQNQSSSRPEVAQMDKMVEALFSRLNSAFSQGLSEFLTDVKCEVNDLKSKLDGLSRDVSRLNQQIQDIRHKSMGV